MVPCNVSSVVVCSNGAHDLTSDHVLPSKKSDFKNIALLLFLYMLQGVPLGITAAIPMLLQNRGVSFKQQAEFSLAAWPFCMKLLWAPIVDSIYSRRFGRRKSWLIPIQYLIGIFMLILSKHVMHWYGGEFDDGNHSSSEINIAALTIAFFILNFLAATQDIAVDGWALTMLNKSNVGFSSTCNSIGQMFGNFLGFVVFIALESTKFCNTFLRIIPEEKGLITLPDYLLFWGVAFILSTTIVAICKREHLPASQSTTFELGYISENSINNESMELSIFKTYKLLVQVFYIQPVRMYCIVLLTRSIMFSACDAVTSLKLIEAGITKDSAALLSTIMMPLKIFLPILISKQTASARPFDIYLKAYPIRIIFSILLALTVWIATLVRTNESDFPMYFYFLLILVFAGYQVNYIYFSKIIMIIDHLL